MYRDGVIFSQDIYQYLNHLRNAAIMGNPEAQLTLAFEYMRGILVTRDFEIAFRWMSNSAKQGVPMAQFYLGYMYRQGIGAEKSRTESERWYSGTVISGNADMFMEIGIMFEFGLDGIVHNEVEAARWYRYGADMGHEGCILSLKMIEHNFKGGKKDTLKERLNRLNQTSSSMERVVRDSAFHLANEYLDSGEFDLSFKNFQKAADLGRPDAMFFLSLMYREGLSVRRNMKKSLELLARAADAGSVDAQFMLGRLYDVGGGLPESQIDAIKYYTMAAAEGYLSAFYYIGKFMNHPEIHVRRSVGKYKRY